MAEVTQEPVYGSGATTRGAFGQKAGLAVQMTGAAMSLALLIGMGVWGFKLVIRDVNGVPVVRAMDGPMRQAPDDPGGELALHTGLAVNEVAGQGEAAQPEETLVLAPSTADLTEEDLMVQPTAEAGEFLPEEYEMAEPARAEVDAPQPIVLSRDDTPQMSTEDILALADQIAAQAEPVSAQGVTGDAQAAITAAVSDAIAGLDPAPEPQEAAGETGAVQELALLTEATDPGATPARALRPPARPASLVSSSAAAAPSEAPASGGGFAVSTADVPEGTVLVQLGAFDSVELAGGEWTELSGRFSEFMDGRDYLIQVATSGGRDFYRLRAEGFADLDDARRFCSALVAEDAPCIPVVVR